MRLQELIAKNKEAQQALLKSSEYASSPALKTYFKDLAISYQELTDYLLKDFKDNIENSKALLPEDDKRWLHPNCIFKFDNDKTLVEESVRGNKVAINYYQKLKMSDRLTESMNKIFRVNHTTS